MFSGFAHAGSATYIAAYAMLRHRYGVRMARLSVTLFHCAVTMYVEITGKACDPGAGTSHPRE